MRERTRRRIFLLAACVAGFITNSTQAADGRMTVVGSDRMGVVVLRDEAPLFKVKEYIVSKGWMDKPRFDGRPTVENGKTRVFEQKGLGFYKAFAKQPTAGVIDLRCEVVKKGADSVQFTFGSQPRTDMRYSYPNEGTGIGLLITPNNYMDSASVRISTSDGKTVDMPYPVPRSAHADVQTVTIATTEGETVRLAFEPAIYLHADHDEMRLFSRRAEKTPAGETMTQAMTMTLPSEIDFEPDNRWIDTSDWFVYEHEDDFSPGSVIGAEDWLEKPAGKRGWVQVDEDKFRFADGTPAKFFAVNISWDDMAVSHEESDQWNDKWAKHGVNLVRLHKFINHEWAGIMTKEDHMIPDPVKIKLFDYYHASARKRGIYTSWSAVFHMKLTPADKTRVKYFDEVKAHDPKQLDVISLKNIAPDIQDLLIKQTIALLDRKNSVTGIRYADDPALAYIELHNEDDIFFPFDNFDKLRKRFPRYFADFQNRFGTFLEAKYGTQDALEKAWGASYPKGKRLKVVPEAKSADLLDLLEEPEPVCEIRPHYPSWEINNGNITPRVVDTLQFLYKEQHDFYGRFVKAIRDAGYEGAICGGCWQASTWLGHLYNTLTDREVGFIDRHNYSGTPMNRPGVGTMSAGFQQVKDRPFNFSEWGGGPEAVPAVAVYGLGLQGWDASCQFSSKIPGTYNKQQRNCNGCCEDFIQIGQYPALSRMVYRGDVKEGDIVANRRISIPGLFEGDVGLTEKFSLLGGGANQKEFSSVVPSRALMAGRVVMEYVDGPIPDPVAVVNVDDYLDDDNKVVRSTTGQLMWDYSSKGYFTVNTPGTQAVIGYAGGKTIELADVSIAPVGTSPFKIYVTSLDREKGIADAKRLLITAFGRDANTGQVTDQFADRPLENGAEPLLLEPVQATITIKGAIKTVRALDHSGRLKDDAPLLTMTRVGDGTTFQLDGQVGKAVYYLVER